MHSEVCPVCNGAGKYQNNRCHGCNGKGWIEVSGNQWPHPDPPHFVPLYPPLVYIPQPMDPIIGPYTTEDPGITGQLFRHWDTKVIC